MKNFKQALRHIVRVDLFCYAFTEELKMSDYKYYLKSDWQEDYAEVTKEQFIKAERAAGFYPKCSSTDKCATGGFSSGSVSGKVEYADPCPAFTDAFE